MKRALGFLLVLFAVHFTASAAGAKKKPGELPIGAWQEEKSGLSVRVAKKAGDINGLAILSGDRMILVSGPPPRAGRADDVFAPDKFSTENGLVRATGTFNWDPSAQEKRPGPVELTIAFEEGAPVLEILRTGDYDRYAVGRHEMKRISVEKPKDSKKGKAKPDEKSGSVITENESTSPAGTTTYRDKNGRTTGTATTSPAGTTTYRAPNGKITGNSSTSPAGTTTHRDDKGRITTTSDTTRGTGGDSTTYYRRNGVIVGQKYISPAGNITWRDGSGRIISGPNW